MRPFLAVVGSAVAALAVFRCLYIYDSLYPLADGAVIGGFIYGCVKASEWLGNPRIPAWALVPAATSITGTAYFAWMVVLMV
jgi:hypothetical protein